MNLIELPASEKKSQRIELCRDPVRIHRLHCFASIFGPKFVAGCREKPGPVNGRVLPGGKMQAFCRFFFERDAKAIALDVVS